MNGVEFSVKHKSQITTYKLSKKGSPTTTEVVSGVAVEMGNQESSNFHSDLRESMKKLTQLEYISCIRKNCCCCWLKALFLRIFYYWRNEKGINSLLLDVFNVQLHKLHKKISDVREVLEKLHFKEGQFNEWDVLHLNDTNSYRMDKSDTVPNAIWNFQKNHKVHGKNPYMNEDNSILSCLYTTPAKCESMYVDVNMSIFENDLKKREKYMYGGNAEKPMWGKEVNLHEMVTLGNARDISRVGNVYISASPYNFGFSGGFNSDPYTRCGYFNKPTLNSEITNEFMSTLLDLEIRCIVDLSQGNDYLSPEQYPSEDQEKIKELITKHDIKGISNPSRYQDNECYTFTPHYREDVVCNTKDITKYYFSVNDGHAPGLDDLLIFCNEVYKTMHAENMKGKNLLIHCAAGAGRSALFLVCYRLYEAVKKLKDMDYPYCFDDSDNNEKSLFVSKDGVNNGVNLAYLMRVIIFQGRDARGVFLCGNKQFKGVRDFAKFLSLNEIS
jgi:hypothetical protein